MIHNSRKRGCICVCYTVTGCIQLYSSHDPMGLTPPRLSGISIIFLGDAPLGAWGDFLGAISVIQTFVVLFFFFCLVLSWQLYPLIGLLSSCCVYSISVWVFQGEIIDTTVNNKQANPCESDLLLASNLSTARHSMHHMIPSRSSVIGCRAPGWSLKISAGPVPIRVQGEKRNQTCYTLDCLIMQTIIYHSYKQVFESTSYNQCHRAGIGSNPGLLFPGIIVIYYNPTLAATSFHGLVCCPPPPWACLLLETSRGKSSLGCKVLQVPFFLFSFLFFFFLFLSFTEQSLIPYSLYFSFLPSLSPGDFQTICLKNGRVAESGKKKKGHASPFVFLFYYFIIINFLFFSTFNFSSVCLLSILIILILILVLFFFSAFVLSCTFSSSSFFLLL